MVRAKASVGQLRDVNRLLPVHNDLCDTRHLCTRHHFSKIFAGVGSVGGK